MRRLAWILVVLVLLAAGGVAALAWYADDDAEPSAPPAARAADEADGELVVQVAVPTKALRADAALITDSEIVDDAVAAVDDALELPADITIQLGGDPEGPYYDPETRTVEYPWQFVAESRRLLAASGYAGAELDTAVVDATRFILHHELGHELIDVLDLPVLGREEDAADGFAAFTAVELEDDGELVIAATDLFAAFDDEAGGELAEDDFFDSHSLDLQRFYSISCQVYGSDPDTYAGVIDGVGLSDERLDECPSEWEQVRTSWYDVLDEHLA